MNSKSIVFSLLGSVAIFSGNVASALTVEEEFTACAVAALETPEPSSVVFTVELPDLESIENQKRDKAGATLELTLTDASTGAEIGEAACVLNKNGKIVKARLDRSSVKVASN